MILYKPCKETDVIEYKLNLLYKARGKYSLDYLAAQTITDVHERVSRRTHIKEKLEALDRMEFSLNNQFAKFAL